MTTSAGLRSAALAGVAVVAVAIALAVAQHHRHHDDSLPAAAGTWYTALAAPYTPAKAKKGACGVTIAPSTAGVAHPVLPCGVKLYVRFGGKEVLTQVVDRGHTVPGREFDVTEALAKLLGLQGTQTIQWRFAR